MSFLSVIHISLLELNVTKFFFITDGSGGRDFSHFPWPQYIPRILPPYLFDWIDVIGDGNCGFRAIAVTKLGDDEAWPLLLSKFMEIQVHRHQYIRLYLSVDR